jgi:opacity protein-like surface antigen
MLRLYYDVATEAPLRPYVGAGVGFANARPNELNCMSQCSSLGDADRAIGYQFMAGVTYELKKDVTFFAEHRLSGLARSSILDNDSASTRLELDGPRDRTFGGGIRIGF